MFKLPNFVDMAKTPEEMKEDKEEMTVGNYPQSIYPYGLCISLDNDALEKLDLSTDVDAGDQVHFQCIGKVTSVSKRETDKGSEARIEIQITHLSLGDVHSDEAPKAPKFDFGKFYNDED